MRVLKKHLTSINGAVIDLPAPSNISYLWNFGSLLGLCLVIQLATGIFLAMHVRHGNTSRSRVTPTQCLNLGMTSELGLRESQGLNIASLLEADKSSKRAWTTCLQVMISKGRAILPESHLPLLWSNGEDPSRSRVLARSRGINAWPWRETASTGCALSTIKEENGIPKGILRIGKVNVRSPTGGNSYGDGDIVVPVISQIMVTVGNRVYLKTRHCQLYNQSNSWKRGRMSALFIIQLRCYVGSPHTDQDISESTVVTKLNRLNQRANYDKIGKIEGKLYNLLSSYDMLLYAYENIKSKSGNLGIRGPQAFHDMTQGITPDTLDGISKEILLKIQEELRSEKFKFKPSRRIAISKASGGTRPLSIAPPRDKIVQEGIRLILEAIFEPTFLPSSHGFRPRRGCHTALKEIRRDFQASTWMIEGDIKKCFDNIDHPKLMNLIENRIGDRQFTKIIWKSLRVGYLEFGHYKHNIVGTPQGSIISPILSNIYMHQLDLYVQEVEKRFNRGTKSRRTKEFLAFVPEAGNARYRAIEWALYKARKLKSKDLIKEAKAWRRNRPAMDFYDPEYRKLSYVRYADDWVIGIRGSLSETQEVLKSIVDQCKEMELEVNSVKTKITNLNRDKALFLGTRIFRAKHRKYVKIGPKKFSRRNRLALRFEAPLDNIKTKLSLTKFWGFNKPQPRFLWLHNDHNQIIALYNSVLRGYLNYYSFVHNKGRLTSLLIWILKVSCAKLLATKFKLGTTRKVYLKFGINLTGPNGKGFIIPSYKVTFKFSTSANPIVGSLYQEKTNSVFENLECAICGATYRVEFHHVRAMKDLNPKISFIDKLMVKANRKRIPLCRKCHMLKHKNKA